MKDMMVYKGYYGSVHYNDEDQIFHGKIEFIRSLVSYEGMDVKNLRIAFEEAIDDYLESNFPRLNRININKINKVGVVRYSSDHLGAFKTIKNRKMRVSTIGRTFLDMLRRPDLCGGIYHVMDVFKEHTNNYLSLIIDEIDQHGKQIDKVRAGYILEELCKIHDERIEAWLQFVQRGGSRKLDSTEEYSSEYSERWCLSINI